MKKYQRMHLIFIRQYIKQIMEYKVDFVVGVLGVFLTQGLNLLFLNVLFQHIPSLEGWTFQEIAFIYGFSLIPKGLDHLFFDNLWALGQRLVRKGEFDKYLTRPINPLFHILVETFQIDALGERFGRLHSIGNNSIKHCLDASQISTFSSLHTICDLDLYFLENRDSQYRFLDQAVRRHDLHFLYV